MSGLSEVLEAMLAAVTSRAGARCYADGPSDENAELDGILDDLEAMVRMLWSIGGYMTPEQQQALRSAMARLAAHGRTVET